MNVLFLHTPSKPFPAFLPPDPPLPHPPQTKPPSPHHPSRLPSFTPSNININPLCLIPISRLQVESDPGSSRETGRGNEWGGGGAGGGEFMGGEDGEKGKGKINGGEEGEGGMEQGEIRGRREKNYLVKPTQLSPKHQLNNTLKDST